MKAVRRYGAAEHVPVLLLYGGLLAFNALAWSWALAAFHGYPTLLGIALLAYSFGLRHAVDADHIAAIDNVTRKLMQAGKRPIAAGLFFSLGHSAVVLLASTVLVMAAGTTRLHLDRFKDIVGEIGTAVSVALLFLVAVMNALILAAALRALRRLRRSKARSGHDMEVSAADRALATDVELTATQAGLLARLGQPLFRLITRSWHMCVLGFLFGLGFDTATEIGVLGISATQAARGVPVWSILAFPVLFAAGMSLVDTLDSTLMVGAYGWAFIQPLRKLYYNIVMLVLSVSVAVGIGSVEALDLLAGRMSLKGSLWNMVSALNERLGTAGYLIIGVFLACWLISASLYRLRRLGFARAGPR